MKLFFELTGWDAILAYFYDIVRRTAGKLTALDTIKYYKCLIFVYFSSGGLGAMHPEDCVKSKNFYKSHVAEIQY